MKKTVPVIVIALICLAVLFRLGFYFYGLAKLPLSSDEAWPTLMAMHILKGEFPVVYWGQTYMGTQESYIAAPLIYLFGPAKWVVRLYPLFFSFLFVFISYRLACRVFNRPVGLLALCLLAMPVPYLAMCGVAVPPDNYLAVTTLGSMALWLTLRLVAREPPRVRDGIFLGALLGYTFWLHLLVISFIACSFAYLFLNDKLLFFRRYFWGLVIAFIVTSLPLWLLNVRNDFATFSDVGRTSDWQRTWECARVAVTYTAQFFTGQRIMLYADNCRNVVLPKALFYGLGFVWGGLILSALAVNWKGLLRLFGFSIKGSGGAPLLVMMAGVSIAVFAHSSRSGADDARYLLPLMAVLPILGAFGIWQVYKRFRFGGIILTLFVMTCQLWGNVQLARAWNDAALVAGPLELPDTRPLIDAMEKHGIRRAYAHYWLSYRITCETGERIIVSEPFNERFPGKKVQYLDEVSRAEKIAFITHPTLLPPCRFEPYFQKIGGSCQKGELGPFTVYYDFKPPCDDRALREIPRSGWKVNSNYSPDQCRYAVDDSLETAWSSDPKIQTPGMVFDVDLGQTSVIGKLRIVPLGNDYPCELTVQVSDDTLSWRTAWRQDDFTLCWENGQPRFLFYEHYVNVLFPAVKARYIRLKQTAGDDSRAWSMADLRLFSPGRTNEQDFSPPASLEAQR